MAHKWMNVNALFGPPGAESTLVTTGVRHQCMIDTGAEMSVVSQSLVDAVYGAEGPPYVGVVEVGSFDGKWTRSTTIPLLVGIEAGEGDPIHAQIECLVGQDDEVVLGEDVLSLLGLEVRIDFQQERVEIERYTWEKFEDAVAAAYRSLRATVRQNVNLSGFQIDMVADERTQSGQGLRLIVECKYYKDRVGNRIVNDFGRVVQTLKERKLGDRGVLVSRRGFTPDASLIADNLGIELLTLEDLQQRRSASETVPSSPAVNPTPPATPAPSSSVAPMRTFFVAMPFTPELEDVYHLGILETVKEAGAACERADEIQHTGGIVEKVYASIRRADAIIAEVTNPNPNVFYEIGFAHALEKPVVLLTKDISNAPFDLRGYNHIQYSSIRELRSKLALMLKTLVGG